jgi:hypothetical protein
LTNEVLIELVARAILRTEPKYTSCQTAPLSERQAQFD